MNPTAGGCPPSTTTCPAYGLGGWGHLMTCFGHHLLIFLVVAGGLLFAALRAGRK